MSRWVIGLLVLGSAACGSSPGAAADGGTGGASQGTAAGTAADDGVDDGTTGVSTGDTTGSGGGGPTVTWHADVRPLVERHCIMCHTEGNIAPFPLKTYEDAFPLRETIVADLDSLRMPPWEMASGCTDFVGDFSVSEEDRAMVSAWVDAGAPEGDPADYVAPEPIDLPSLSRTDLTLQIPEPYVPTLMPDEYRCFLFDWPETETTYVTGFQFEPDNTTIAHHSIAYIVAPADVPDYEQRDADDPGPGYTCFGGPGGSAPLDFIASRWLSAWAPGALVGDLPEGTGIRMEPGSKIVLQMHYNTLAFDGKPDQSQMHYRLDSSVDREAFMLPWADPTWISGGMNIPAGSADTVHEFSLDPTTVIDLLTNYAIPGGVPLELFSVMHHMHKLGTKGHQSIERADGTSECLLDVPKFDFDWQHTYLYAEPKILQPGDQLKLSCQWDNSTSDQAVNWGDGTADEMCLGLHYLAVAN